MELSLIIEKFILVTVVFVVSLVIAMYSTLAERKIAGFMQDRYGPDRAGIFGLLQPLCDGGKFFFKEEIIPSGAHKTLFIIGPTIAIITACISSAVIPWGQDLTIGDRVISLQVADINVGILYMFGVIALGVYGIMLGGWASNNKFSLMGAIRAASQSISYEIPMGLSIIALLMATLYFGGYNFPFMYDLGLSANWITVLGVIAFFIKIFAFIFFFMWVRWTLPRFRYDQLMNLGWKMLIPLAIANIVLTGVFSVVKNTYF